MLAPVNLILIGCGRMGSIHFQTIQSHPIATCKYVIAKTLSESQEFLQRHNVSASVAASDDLEAVLKEHGQDIHGAVIASSTDGHYEQIKLCLQYKKAVFCEKPIAETLSEIDELYKLAATNHLPPISVGFQRRFDPNVQMLYKQIHENNILLPSAEETAKELNSATIGGIEKIVSISKDPTYPPMDYIKSSINGFYDSIVHDIDIICYLSKQFPVKVYSAAHAHYEPIAKVNDFDRVFVVLEFESGLLGMVDWCRHSGFSYDQRLNILGWNGMLEMTNDKDNVCVIHNNEGAQIAKPKNYFQERYLNAYRNEICEFIEVVQGKRKVITTHQQMRNVICVVAAAEKSARTGMPVVIDYNPQTLAKL